MGKGRSIRLTQKATTAFREHRRRQLEGMQDAGFCSDHGLVFPSNVGTHLSGGDLNRAFKATFRRAGLPEIHFHDLRHTCTMLLFHQAVNPKYVRELLGHADISLTLNVCSRMLPDTGDARLALWTTRSDSPQWCQSGVK